MKVVQGRTVLEPTDFRLDKTRRGYLWHSEDMSGIPVITLPDGPVFEPGLRYFSWGRLTRLFKACSSMIPEAYTLRDWLCYLSNEAVDWSQAGDEELRSYRLFKGKPEGGEISEAQIATKLTHIYKFYYHLPRAMPFLQRERTPIFVGRPGEFGTNISSKFADSAEKRTIWSGWQGVDRAKAKRPTPDLDSVKIILGRLRKKSFLEPDGTWERTLRVCEAERNWLIARCEAEAGTRRAETQGMLLSQFALALAKHRIIEYDKKVKRENPLSVAAYDSRLRKEILDGILKLQARGYTTLNVVIAKKGGGQRGVEFPLDLVVDLLDIGIWTVRRTLFDRWRTAGYQVDDEALFLSSTGNGGRLEVGSVGDIVNDAFKDIGGSGHRLRAFYLTTMAWLLWNQYLAIANYRHDVSIDNMVLNRLADLAGHKTPGVLERYYLDMAILLHQSVTNEPRLNAAANTMNALKRVAPTMSQPRLELLEELIKVMATTDDELFFEMQKHMVDRFRTKLDARPKQHPDLRLVGKREPGILGYGNES